MKVDRGHEVAVRVLPGMALVVALAAGCGSGGGHPAAVASAKIASPSGSPAGTPAATSAGVSVQAQTLKAALSPAVEGEKVLRGPVAGTVATLGTGSGATSGQMPGLSAKCQDMTGTPSRWPRWLRDSPAAMLMKQNVIGVSSEQLVLIPATTDPHLLRVSVASGCPLVTTQANGRTVKLRMAPLGRARLPHIPGADVTAVELRMEFPDLAISGGTVWMNVRQGRLLMVLSFLTTTSKPDDGFMEAVAQLAWSLAKEATL